MATSIYTPLQNDVHEFRLLVLQHSTDRLAPLRCELNLATFEDDDIMYTALSYTWGDPMTTTPILVNGVETEVTVNLEEALRHIRKPKDNVILWVDALCINQNDVAEKNHQVEMMRQIFAGAELVIAWLGSASDDSDVAMELLGNGIYAWMESQGRQECSCQEEGLDHTGISMLNDERRDHARVGDPEGGLATSSAQIAGSQLVTAIKGLHLPSPTALTNIGATDVADADDEYQNDCRITDQSRTSSISQASDSRDSDTSYLGLDWQEFEIGRKQLTARESLAISRLLQRSWWTRIWVVQEILLAMKVVFKCGDAEVPAEKMIRYVRKPGYLSILLTLCDDRNSFDHYCSALRLIMAIGNINESDNAIDYLFSYGRQKATRPHDHIYGLLGIIPEKDRMVLGAPDYECRAEDLFIGVTTKLMLAHNSLDILMIASKPASSTATSSTKMDLPSWVPDWTRPLFLEPSRRQSGGIAAFSEPKFQFSKDSTVLTLNCFEMDKIESVKPVPALAQGRIPIWQSVAETEHTSKDQGLPPIQKLLVALFLDDTGLEHLQDERGFKLVAPFFQELQNYNTSLVQDKISDVHDRTDYLAGFLSWIGEERDGRADADILAKLFSTDAAHSFVTWYQRQSSADLQRFYMRYSLFRTFHPDYSMFRTFDGSFGMTASGAVPGDILCAVPTCPVPLILRRVQPSKYMLVGSTDEMAGTLHGELAQAAEKGEILSELFTLV